MTETTISLLSIITGIVAIYLFVYVTKHNNLSFTANTIIGVFGSILFIKSFGRFGFTPTDIVQQHQIHYSLLLLNLVISAIGAVCMFLLIIYISKNLPK